MLGIRSSPRLAKTRKPERPTEKPPVSLKKGVSRLSLSESDLEPFVECRRSLSARETLCKYFYRSTSCRIVGRVEEKYALAQFLASDATLLFIGGNPGTGKTALVTEFLNQEKRLWTYINVMDDPHLRRALPKCDVVVLDEVDSINDAFARSQQLISSGIAKKVIGIANTIDLMLANESARSIIFPPYNVQDIIAIINDRIQQAQEEAQVDFTIDPIVIELVARKSAGLGDLRRSLDLFRSIALSAPLVDHSLGLPDAIKVLNEFSAPSAASLLDRLSLHQKILLTSLLSTNNKNAPASSSKSSQTTLEALYEAYRRICRESRIAEAIAKSDFFDLLSGLEAESILHLKKKRTSQVPDWSHSVLLGQESMRDTFTRELRKVPLLCDYLP